jgi:hypothetical protein
MSLAQQMAMQQGLSQHQLGMMQQNQLGAAGHYNQTQQQAAAIEELHRRHVESHAEILRRQLDHERLRALQKVEQAQAKPPTKEKKMNLVKEYLNKHRDTVMTLGFALLVDHFVLNGALRERIRRVVEALLTKVEKALGVADDVKELK